MCRFDPQVETLIRGAQSIGKTLVKYRSELDEKVKFPAIQDAIDAIGEAMLDYNGVAKLRMPSLRRTNSKARELYRKCVGEVFEWCVTNHTIFLELAPEIGSKDLSDVEKNHISSLLAKALKSGLTKVTHSLELLKDVKEQINDLEGLFHDLLADVHKDFGQRGFYGSELHKLQEEVDSSNVKKKCVVSSVVGGLFAAIGCIVFGPIGLALGLVGPATYGLMSLAEWKRKKNLREQIEAIKNVFETLKTKIRDATEIVRDMQGTLKEEDTNLRVLRGSIESCNMKMILLDCPTPRLREKLANALKDLGLNCEKYAKWHGYGSLYKNN
ncbi:hypothetical protein KR018_006444 [Drosophila ironensis]|nr:hypothetical protein KR018_006444 [Drosophila ironensis]